MPLRTSRQISLLTLMLIMLVFCMVGAAGSYLQSRRAPTNSRAFFVLFTLVAPMLLLTVVTVSRQLVRLVRLARRPPPPTDPPPA